MNKQHKLFTVIQINDFNNSQESACRILTGSGYIGLYNTKAKQNYADARVRGTTRVYKYTTHQNKSIIKNDIGYKNIDRPPHYVRRL